MVNDAAAGERSSGNYQNCYMQKIVIFQFVELFFIAFECYFSIIIDKFSFHYPFRQFGVSFEWNSCLY